MAHKTRDARPLAGPGARNVDQVGPQITSDNKRHAQRFQGAQIIRLPVFTDGVFIGNEFIRISPRLRARIREMAMEARR